MKTILLIVSLASLAGCQTLPPQPPHVVTEIREIQGPPKVVKEPCLSLDEIEALPPAATVKGVAPAEVVSNLAIDATRFARIAKKQQEQLRACAKLSAEEKKSK